MANAQVIQILMNGGDATNAQLSPFAFRYAFRRARSARRLNDAAPKKLALRGGSQGSARNPSTVSATLRGCSISGVSRVATFEHIGRIGCFLWLLSLQQQRK
jgi:hypothetical protein